MMKKTSIIIVDDQRLYRQSLGSSLSDFNIQVIGEAENGLQLFELLKMRNADVILLDVEMPEMNGSETLDSIRRVMPASKVIIVSQYNDEILMRDFMSRGANAFITKNTDIEIIADAIQKVHATGTYSPSAENVEHVEKAIFNKREREIILLACKGKQVKDIGQELNISPKTVETHLTDIYRKLGVRNRAEFLIYAVKEGLNYLGTNG